MVLEERRIESFDIEASAVRGPFQRQDLVLVRQERVCTTLSLLAYAAEIVVAYDTLCRFGVYEWIIEESKEVFLPKQLAGRKVEPFRRVSFCIYKLCLFGSAWFVRVANVLTYFLQKPCPPVRAAQEAQVALRLQTGRNLHPRSLVSAPAR